MSGASGDNKALAARHDVPVDAVVVLREALRRGGGTQAQFDHPALGGMGQWSRGGGIMIGDMFNHALKAKVERLCQDLASLATEDPAGEAGGWWPSGLGRPSATGSQNDASYAFFPLARRLAVRSPAGVSLYDTKGYSITGAAQRQDRDGAGLAFATADGRLRLDELTRLEGAEHDVAPRRTASGGDREARAPVGNAADDPLALIERLHDLLRRGIVTAEEFAAKKAELLGRI